MNKKKILTTALLSVLTLSACGSIAYVSSQNNRNDFISNQLDSNVVENGISVKCAIVEDSTAKYGAQKFSYSINMNTSITNVLYKVKYIDGTTISNDILTITHNESNKTIQVDCNDVFLKQIVLTIYLEHNEDIKADVTIDFVEILSVHSSIVQEEDYPFVVNDRVSTTGGSIEVDKTIKNSIFSWNNELRDELTDYLLNFLFDDVSVVTYAYTNLPSIDEYFADDNRKSFNTYEFVSEIYTDIETDDGYSESIYFKDLDEVFLNSLPELTILEKAIYHSFSVNNKKYEYYFPLEIQTTYLQATSLSSEIKSMKFGGEISSSENESSGGSTIVSDVTIDYSKCSDKSALDGGSGAVLSTGYNNMWISDFVSVEPGKTIEFSSEPYKVCYYTSDKTFIKQDKFTTSNTMTKIYTIPSNASYIRFQYCSDSSYDVPAVSFDNRTNITINYVD